jgi:ATP-dependent Clp protease adaptor protein ClpS
MLTVHHQGKAVVGTYTLEVAETKVAQVETMARDNQYPLKASMEEA